MKISTHALTWSATAGKHRYKCHHKRFQLTHSRGVRRFRRHSNSRQKTFQLTHSRGVRRRPSLSTVATTVISTHALTWSATTSCDGICNHRRISTHALTWSATCFHCFSRCHYAISTHALTWSATGQLQLNRYCLTFQLTHSRGVRLVRIQGLAFQ